MENKWKQFIGTDYTLKEISKITKKSIPTCFKYLHEVGWKPKPREKGRGSMGKKNYGHLKVERMTIVNDLNSMGRRRR